MSELADIHNTIHRPDGRKTAVMDTTDYIYAGKPFYLPIHVGTVNGIERYGRRRVRLSGEWLIVRLWAHRPPEYMRTVKVLLAP